MKKTLKKISINVWMILAISNCVVMLPVMLVFNIVRRVVIHKTQLKDTFDEEQLKLTFSLNPIECLVWSIMDVIRFRNFWMRIHCL